MARQKMIDREWTSYKEACGFAAWCSRQYGKTFAVCQVGTTYRVGRIGQIKALNCPILYKKTLPSRRSIKRTAKEQREVALYWKQCRNVVKTATQFQCSTATVYRIISLYGRVNG